MILLLAFLTQAHPSTFNCQRQTISQEFEYGIAMAIERLGPVDGPIFSAIIRGYNYDAIAKHFNKPIGIIMDIADRGGKIMWEYRK